MQEQAALGTMHVKDGWHFQRLPNGDVRIYDMGDRQDLDCIPYEIRDDPAAEITIPTSEWQSIIAGMSANEDSAESFHWAALFHGGKFTFNKPDKEHPLHRLSEL